MQRKMSQFFSCHLCCFLLGFLMVWCDASDSTFNFTDVKFLDNVCKNLNLDLPKSNEECQSLLAKMAARYCQDIVSSINDAGKVLFGEAYTKSEPNSELEWKILFEAIESKCGLDENLLEALDLNHIPQNELEWFVVQQKMNSSIKDVIDFDVRNEINSLLCKKMSLASDFTAAFHGLANWLPLIPTQKEVQILQKYGAYKLVPFKEISKSLKAICTRQGIALILRSGVEKYLRRHFYTSYKYNQIDECKQKFEVENFNRKRSLEKIVQEAIMLAHQEDVSPDTFETKRQTWLKGLEMDRNLFPKTKYTDDSEVLCLKDAVLRLWNASDAQQAIRYWDKDKLNVWKKFEIIGNEAHIPHEDILIIQNLSLASTFQLQCLNIKDKNKRGPMQEVETDVQYFAANLFYNPVGNSKNYKECMWIFYYNNGEYIQEFRANLTNTWGISEQDFCENINNLWDYTSNLDFHAVNLDAIRDNCKPCLEDIEEYAHGIGVRNKKMGITIRIMFEAVYDGGMISKFKH